MSESACIVLCVRNSAGERLRVTSFEFAGCTCIGPHLWNSAEFDEFKLGRTSLSLLPDQVTKGMQEFFGGSGRGQLKQRANASHSSADVTTISLPTPRPCPCKYRLTRAKPPTYSSYIGKTVPIGFGDLRIYRRTTALERFFYVRTPTRAYSINGWALVGRPSGLPVAPFGDGERD
jgi:hypothetical protein